MADLDWPSVLQYAQLPNFKQVIVNEFGDSIVVSTNEGLNLFTELTIIDEYVFYDRTKTYYKTNPFTQESFVFRELDKYIRTNDGIVADFYEVNFAPIVDSLIYVRANITEDCGLTVGLSDVDESSGATRQNFGV